MKKSEQILLFILILFSLAIISMNQNSVFLLVKNKIFSIFKPIAVVFSSFKNGIVFWQNAIFNIKELKRSNEQLVQEKMDLYGKIARISSLEDENALLREQLKLEKESISVVLSKIIGRDFQNNRNFLIDKGKSDGLKTGMPVILPGNILIGRIVEVGSDFSKVQTIIDTQSKIAAITAETKISGLVRGLGSDMIFDLIAKNKEPNPKELIISSGVDGIWPRGFAIGRVEKISSAESQVFNSAEISAIIGFSNFQDVFVILEKK